MSSVQFPAPVAAASSVAPVAAVSGTTAGSGNSAGSNARTAAGGQSAADAALLGAKGLGGAAAAAATAPTLASAANQLAASWPTAAAPTLTTPATPAAPIPVLPQAQQTHISAQAREALGAGFDPRGAAPLPATANANAAINNNNNAAATAATTLSGGAHQAAPVTAAWPASGLEAPLRHLVQSLVQQVTTQGGGHAGQQRVVAAQVWPLSLAHALESGGEDGENSPMQTWLVRQGTVQTAEGPRGMTLTLRVPAPWLASLASLTAQAAPATAPAAASSSGLQAAYLGAPQNLQSGVLALVLQGMGAAAAARTSALLVLDFQPQLMTAGAAVYGRDLLQARHDPWVQQAQLQASGQLEKDDDIARQREREAGLCQALGCPYALRAACAQPFCLEMRVGTPLAAPMAALDVIAGRAGTAGSVTRL